MRIKSWHFATRQHRELVPRSLIALQVNQVCEVIFMHVSQLGILEMGLNFLKKKIVCV